LKLELKRMNRLIQRASVSPFYRDKLGGAKRLRAVDTATFSEKIAPFTLEELIEEKSHSGDPYSSRWCKKKAPILVFQLEYDTEPRLYLPLDRSALKGYAEALIRCWSLLGLEKGDKVAIFDYGTSPLSFLASASYTPYLTRGAAEALGCLPVCNDGVANMSQRAVEILKFIRPRIFFLRSDCLQPFINQVETAAVHVSDYARALVIAECEGALSRKEQTSFEERLGVPVYQMLRIDAAMFLAVECPQCRLLHTWQDLYLVENLREDGGEIHNGAASGPLLITNWFALNCPTLRYASHIRASLVAPGCPRAPRDQRIAL
jgi:phenylacetate-coenzyme A ligase PaaK-like adenylate-forming protein